MSLERVKQRVHVILKRGWHDKTVAEWNCELSQCQHKVNLGICSNTEFTIVFPGISEVTKHHLVSHQLVTCTYFLSDTVENFSICNI